MRGSKSGQHTHLHEVCLGLINTCNIAEGDASVGLHLEFGLGLAKCHRVAGASATTHATAAPASAGEEEQAANEQQREGKVAEQVEKNSATILCMSMEEEGMDECLDEDKPLSEHG